MESIKSPATSAPKPAKPDLDEVIVVEAVLESGHGVKFQEKSGVVFVTSISSGSHACTVLKRGDYVLAAVAGGKQHTNIAAGKRSRRGDSAAVETSPSIDLTQYIFPSMYPIRITIQRRLPRAVVPIAGDSMGAMV